MTSIIVAPRISAIPNFIGAVLLQNYLISAPVQARIRAYRYAGFSQQFWWPSAQHGVPPDKLLPEAPQARR